MPEVCLMVGMGESLGEALVRKFAAEGIRVAFVGRRAESVAQHEQRLRAMGLAATGYAADAANEQAMADVVTRITSEWGAPTLLIYNAAVMQQGPLVDAPPSAARRSFEANALGALNSVQQVLPGMRQAGRGTILISGGAAALHPHPGWGILALGKAALRSITLSLAQELAPENIRVNSVVIHGSIQYDPWYAPDRIADTFWSIYAAPDANLPVEVEFKRPEEPA